MKKKTIYVAIVLILSAFLIVLTLLCQAWSQSFYDFTRLDKATTLCVSTPWEPITADTPTVEIEKEELSEFLDLMTDASVRFDGISRQIHGKAGDKLYQLVFCRYENEERLKDIEIVLCSDGSLYVPRGRGYFLYCLENCDIDTINRKLESLLQG